MKLLVAALAFTAALAPAHAQEALTYKGLQLGATAESFREKFPAFRCAGDSCEYSRALCKPVNECDEKNSFGGAIVDIAIARFTDGRLGSLYFTMLTRFAENLTKAAAERYGAPTSTSDEPFRTKGGAVIPNLASTWARGTDTMVVRLNAGRVGEGSASLVSSDYAKKQAAASKAATSKAAQDF